MFSHKKKYDQYFYIFSEHGIRGSWKTIPSSKENDSNAFYNPFNSLRI